MIVVDASVVVEVLLRTEDSEAIERRILAANELLCAPHLLDVEVAQVVRRFCLSGNMTDNRGSQALGDLADMPIEFFSHTPFLSRIWALKNNYIAYHAVYIALAETLGCTLITRDPRLANSPAHSASVEVI